MGASRKGPSLLLRHINCSLSALAHIYEQQAGLGGSLSTALTKSNPLSVSPFPHEPTTAEEGERVLSFFCEELGMGADVLSTWRFQLHESINRRWGPPYSGAPDKMNLASAAHPATLSSSPEAISVQQGLEDKIFPSSGSSAYTKVDGDRKLWFMPRAADSAFINSCRFDLKAIISPFVTLSPRGYSTWSAAIDTSQSPPRAHSQTSRFYATKHIPAGMFVLSLPTEAVFFADPPRATDPLLDYFIHLEDLAGQLISVSDDPTAPHFGYVQYLKENVVPVRNLPFISREEVMKLLKIHIASAENQAAGSVVSSFPPPTLTAVSQEDTAEPRTASTPMSPALSLWDFFHQDMKGEPLSPYVREKLRFTSPFPSDGDRHTAANPTQWAIGKAEYAWWISLVLSRREGSATLVPLIDKLNHSPLPNTSFTMSTPSSLCGIDVLDNLFAGVPLEWLCHPYVHVFTIREVQPGEELTLCYTSAPDGLYRPRSTAAQPPKPAFLNPGMAAGSSWTPQQMKGGELEGMGPEPERRDRRQDDLYEQALDVLFTERGGEASGQGLSVLGGGGNLHASARRYLHPGPHLAQSPEGKAAWQLQWGFVPPVDAVYSASDLREIGALVAERRVDSRSLLFPPFLSAHQ
ncbi:unnamed protein product [Phytomonas sp. Hart1]|nr:unnamed protein product [Phytomonas sp. Hart1]|eukprot:CCW69601.1 unnamed protein product [Phytomonas sp. isolate Hart1]